MPFAYRAKAFEAQQAPTKDETMEGIGSLMNTLHIMEKHHEKVDWIWGKVWNLDKYLKKYDQERSDEVKRQIKEEQISAWSVKAPVGNWVGPNLNVYRKKIAAAKCFSLDIFDTILFRKVRHPLDVFTYIENIAGSEGATLPFRQLRISAENVARELTDL